jgi:lipoate-protein ligase A
LTLVAEGRRGPLLRHYRPAPTLAFGRRDTFLPGFTQAASAARRHGFEPVVRAAGGRAAAYHADCLILDEIMPAAGWIGAVQERFAEEAGRQAKALRGLGIDARVGEVPGEYCPGQFSVNARGRVKLIGAAQRIVQGAWLLSSVVVVRDAEPLRAVLEEVYAALELAWEPATVGGVANEATGLSVEDVTQVLLAEYAQRYRLHAASLQAAELTAARALLERHRVEV